MDVILTGKQAVFVATWVDNETKPDAEKLTAQEVAVKAGYAPKNARAFASKLLANDNIIVAIAARKRQLAEAAAGLLDVDAKRVIAEWATIATGDPSEIVYVRRLNCRHCWGFLFNYQFTDAEYARETAQEMEDAQVNRRPVQLERFTGGGGYRHTKDPNPACPECCGEGVPDVYVKDLRKLTDKQRRLIASVKQGKYGIEITYRDQDNALKNLAQWLGLLVNKNEHTGPGGGPIPVAAVNYSLPADPQEAARAYQLLMEGKR